MSTARQGSARSGGGAIGPLLAESFRLSLLRGLEERLEAHGFSRIAGVDEAGRGALAGPVFAAAVIMDPGRLVPGVDDSKLVPEEKRERLAVEIRRAAVCHAVASSSAAEIDCLDILKASRRAMIGALLALQPPPDCAVVDAVGLAGMPFPSLPVIRGDSIAYSVACASVLAKVARDAWMRRLDAEYPQFGFAAHKGYAAAAHRAALARFGPSPVHRLTFRGVLPTAADRGTAPTRRRRTANCG